MATLEGWMEARAVAAVFAIYYWVPLLPEETASLDVFGNFSRASREVGLIAERAVRWPFDIRELFSDRPHVVNSRQRGFSSTHLRPVPLASLRDIVEASAMPFNVVVSSEATVAEVSEVVGQFGADWLHISEAQFSDAIVSTKADEKVFRDYFYRVAASRSKANYRHLFKEFLKSRPRKWRDMYIDRSRVRSDETRANEDALEGFGISFARAEPAAGGAVPSAVDVETMVAVRDGLLSRYGLALHANDLTLCVESIGWGLTRDGFRRLSIAGAKLARREADLIYGRALSAGFASEFGQLSEKVESALVAARDAERQALNGALLLHSGTRLTPVLRLPPALNRSRPALLEIGQCARADSPHRDFKVNKLGRRLGDSMASLIDATALSHIRGSGGRIGEISLIADLPLEWLPVDGLPLCMKHDVSRIPFSPGEALMRACADNEISYISDESLSDVLVVRSFLPGDPIAGHLEQALEGPLGAPDAPSPKIHFVDVGSTDEFVAVVSGYKGSLLIFDGHGSRDAYSGVGSVVVGGRPLDIRAVGNELRFPPIVLLSACDTFPIDGSHGSAAAGMLALGARTVLGTLLPIYSIRSCVFLARLVWRIAGLLPLEMERNPRGVNWRFMMSGMLRMVYASEILFPFAAAHRLSTDQRSEIQFQANQDINFRNPNWYNALQERMARAANTELSRVKNYCNEYAWITDSMKYVQLGRPELVHVVKAGPLVQRR